MVAARGDERLLQARALIDESFQSAISVRRMARSAGMSQFHFIRRFERAFRRTPHQYLRDRRLERAKELLRDEALSVTEICFEVGFESLGSFSALFRRAFGEAPTAYRARQRRTRRRGIPACFSGMGRETRQVR